MFYSNHETVIPHSRIDVWNMIDGKTGYMDKVGVFYPEYEDFSVVRIVRKTRGIVANINLIIIMNYNYHILDGSRSDLLKRVTGTVKQCFTKGYLCLKPSLYMHLFVILEDDQTEIFSSCLRPVLKSINKPINLIVLSSIHPRCRYLWTCLEKRDYSYPDTPVLYVNEPNVFTCSVLVDGDVIHTLNFDVTHIPDDG